MSVVQYNPATGRIALVGDVSGSAIWAVGQWLEAHDDEEPYVIYAVGEGFGYRFTVERIPNPWEDDPEVTEDQWDDDGGAPR